MESVTRGFVTVAQLSPKSPLVKTFPGFLLRSAAGSKLPFGEEERRRRLNTGTCNGNSDQMLVSKLQVFCENVLGWWKLGINEGFLTTKDKGGYMNRVHLYNRVILTRPVVHANVTSQQHPEFWAESRLRKSRNHMSSVQNPDWLFDMGIDYTAQLHGDLKKSMPI